MSAYEELMEFLQEGEVVEALVLGPYGWGCDDDGGEGVPVGEILVLDEAKPHMQTWSFYGGFGAPDCHSVCVWTNERVIFVYEYDGSTGLSSMPRHPTAFEPDMPGGG